MARSLDVVASCDTEPVPLRKLTTTDAFVVTDLADAPAAGVVRRGRKILQSSAKDLARSATYTFAIHGIERGGASAGINAEGDAAGASADAFVAELADDVAGGVLELTAGKGIGAEELAGLAERSPAGALSGSTAAIVRSVMAGLCVGLDTTDLAGVSVAIDGWETGPVPAALVDALVGVGAEISAIGAANGVIAGGSLDLDALRAGTMPDPASLAKPWTLWGAGVDAILTGAKPGGMNHQGAEMVRAKAVVPYAPIPVSTKAYAVLRRAGVVLVPDFASAGGGLVAATLEGDDATVLAEVDRTTVEALAAAAADHPDQDLFMAACIRAEAFLATWQERLPFGRPLAA